MSGSLVYAQSSEILFVCLFEIFMYLFAYLFFLFGHIAWHVGSQYPDQGLNPGPLQWKLTILTIETPGRLLKLLIL